MTPMTDSQRSVSLVGGPHDSMIVDVPRKATSAVLYCWENKPVVVKPADDPRRFTSVYTQRGDDEHHMMYRADVKIEVHE